MDLKKAIADIEDEFSSEGIAGDTWPVVEFCSGGVRKGIRDPFPALYANESLAVEAWYRDIFEYLDNGGKPSSAFAWVEKPSLEKFYMTTQDNRGTQRVTTDRFIVRCKVAVRQ